MRLPVYNREAECCFEYNFVIQKNSPKRNKVKLKLDLVSKQKSYKMLKFNSYSITGAAQHAFTT